MGLSRQALSDYDAALSRVEGAAAEWVRRRVSAYLDAYPQASVAEAREFAKMVVAEAVDSYGDAASEAACELYDGLADAAGRDLPAAAVDDSDVSSYVDDAVRYQARKLADGAPSAFAGGCAACASDQVSRRANATMLANAGRDRVRWARVPMGGETCTYCAMLASRGFSYRSRSSAAAAAGPAAHWHRNCRCKVVPETAGSVEGYDPDEWYERWQEMEAIDADDSVAYKDKAALKANVILATDGDLRVSFAVGAKALRDYTVNMPGGVETRFYPGSEIEEKKVFAGKGTGVPLRVADRLADQYQGSPDEWYHVSGEGWIFDPGDDGRIKKAEIHWMASDEHGLHEFWFKRWVGRYRDA